MIKSQSEVEGEGWILTLCRTFVKNQRSMETWVIEVTEFNFEVSLDLRGLLEATMASEATKMAVRGNMHIKIRVFEMIQTTPTANYDP